MIGDVRLTDARSVEHFKAMFNLPCSADPRRLEPVRPKTWANHHLDTQINVYAVI